MDRLLPIAERIAIRLVERKETIAVAEGSAGGLISAALLAVPGASAYFIGGAVVYTGAARNVLAGIGAEDMKGLRPGGEPYAARLPRQMCKQLNTIWGLAEAGAAGPAGNRYGDPAGHTCIAVAGPSERAITLETGSDDRLANMRAFAVAALQLMAASLAENKRAEKS